MNEVHTFPELVEELENTEETILIELLGITSDEIVTAFLDLIEENQDWLKEKVFGNAH